MKQSIVLAGGGCEGTIHTYEDANNGSTCSTCGIGQTYFFEEWCDSCSYYNFYSGCSWCGFNEEYDEGNHGTCNSCDGSGVISEGYYYCSRCEETYSYSPHTCECEHGETSPHD